METNNRNQSAFPFVEPTTSCDISFGLTKREWLAGLALQGLAANGQLGNGGKVEAEWSASAALGAADALLAELNKEVPSP